MAETAATTTVTALKTQLAESIKEKALRLQREREERKVADAAEKAAAKAKREERKAAAEEIKALVSGPDYQQAGVDIATIFVGEAVFRGLQFALQKIGAVSWLWYSVLPAGLSIPGYIIAYPRKEEGVVRKFFRAWSLQTLIVSVHDGVGYVLAGRKTSKEQAALLQAQVDQLQAQIQAGTAKPVNKG